MIEDPRPQNFPIYNKLKELIRVGDRWSFWHEVLDPALKEGSRAADKLALASKRRYFDVDELYLVLEELFND